jgi:putative phosphoesterase
LARIGLLSDSHGRAATTQRATRLLIEHGAEVLLHLGDIGTLEVLDAMIEKLDAAGKPDPPVHIVFGNCDWDCDALSAYAVNLGISVDDPVGRLKADGRVVVFQHGHQEAAMEQTLAGGADYLCHGHTHEARDDQLGATRVINPGALFRASQYSVALLDTATGEVQFITVPRE